MIAHSHLLLFSYNTFIKFNFMPTVIVELREVIGKQDIGFFSYTVFFHL